MCSLLRNCYNLAFFFFLTCLLFLFRYLTENLNFSGWWKKQNDQIPEFLRARPPMFRECLQQPFAASLHVSHEDITDCGNGHFRVKGSKDIVYDVHVGEDRVVPTCTCIDFCRQRRLCKHILALFILDLWTWEKLPCAYRDSVFLNADTAVLEGATQRAAPGEESAVMVPDCEFGNINLLILT